MLFFELLLLFNHVSHNYNNLRDIFAIKLFYPCFTQLLPLGPENNHIFRSLPFKAPEGPFSLPFQSWWRKKLKTTKQINRKTTTTGSPRKHRFRTMTPPESAPIWHQSDCYLPISCSWNLHRQQLCLPSRHPHDDYHSLIFTVSDSTWVLRVGTFNNTRQLINPHCVTNPSCFISERLSFFKARMQIWLFFFNGRCSFKSNHLLPKKPRRRMSPCSVSLCPQDNHDDNWATPTGRLLT